MASAKKSPGAPTPYAAAIDLQLAIQSFVREQFSENLMSNIKPIHGDENKPFLSDVKDLRNRAREHIERGVVTKTYIGDVEQTIDILQTVLATELVCVLRYTQHSIVASGLASEGVKAEFAQHAKEEQAHALAVAERINQLGGQPDFDPKGLASRSASEYGVGSDLAAMIRENLIAERIAVDHYRELVRFFGDDDPATRVMIETILAVEEEHASDMLDLLSTHGPATG